MVLVDPVPFPLDNLDGYPELGAHGTLARELRSLPDWVEANFARKRDPMQHANASIR